MDNFSFFHSFQNRSSAKKRFFDAFPANQFGIFANFSFVKNFLQITTEKLFLKLTEYSDGFSLRVQILPGRGRRVGAIRHRRNDLAQLLCP